MQTKNKIGALVVLGGIALLGVYSFKKNKPNVASSQSKGLEALSNFYKTGGGNEETFIKGQTAIVPTKMEQLVSILSGAEKKAINESTNLAINCSMPFLAQQNGIDCTEYCKANPKNCPTGGSSTSNGISVDWSGSNLSSLGLAGIDFSNIKMK